MKTWAVDYGPSNPYYLVVTEYDDGRQDEERVLKADLPAGIPVRLEYAAPQGYVTPSDPSYYGGGTTDSGYYQSPAFQATQATSAALQVTSAAIGAIQDAISLNGETPELLAALNQAGSAQEVALKSYVGAEDSTTVPQAATHIANGEAAAREAVAAAENAGVVVPLPGNIPFAPVSPAEPGSRIEEASPIGLGLLLTGLWAARKWL